MNKFILAKKVGMSQLFQKDGEVIPVTLLEAGPNVVNQIKTEEKDGYKAIQIGFSKTKAKSLTKSEQGQRKGRELFKYLKEFRVGDVSGFKQGDEVRVDVFAPGDKVKASSKTIGRGFQGVVKRHGFSGGPASHGHRHVLRKPGSIGSSFPQKVFKGKKMAGRMGFNRVSVKNLEVVRVDKKNNLLFIKGAIPGKKGTLVEIVGLAQKSENS